MNASGFNKTKTKRVAVHTPAGRSESRSPSPFSGGNKGFSFGKPKPSGRSESRSPDRSNPQKKVSKVKKDLYDHVARGRASQSPGRGHSSGVKRTQSQGPAASGDESGDKSQKPYPRKKKVVGGRAQSPGGKSPGDDRGRRSQDKGSRNPIQEASKAEEDDGDNQEKRSPAKKKVALGRRIVKPGDQTSGSEVQQKQEDQDKGSGDPIPEFSETEEDGDGQEKKSPPKAKVARGPRIVKPGEQTSGSEVQQKQSDSKPDDQEGCLDGEGAASKEEKPARKGLGTHDKVDIKDTGVKPDASGGVVLGDLGPGGNPSETDMDTWLGIPQVSAKVPEPTPEEEKPVRERLVPRETLIIKNTGLEQDASNDMVMGNTGNLESEVKPIEGTDTNTQQGVPKVYTKAPKPASKEAKTTVADGKEREGTELDPKPDDQEGRLDGESTAPKEKNPIRKRLVPRETLIIKDTGREQDVSSDVVMGNTDNLESEIKSIEETDTNTQRGVPKVYTKAPKPASKDTKTTVGDRKGGEGTEFLEGGPGGAVEKDEDGEDDEDRVPGSEGVGSRNTGGSKKHKKAKPQRLSEKPDASEAEEEGASEAEEEEDLSLESAAERRRHLQKGEPVPTKDIEPELRTADAAIAAAIALQRRNGVMVVSDNIRKAIAAAATEEQRSKWPDIALGTFQVLLLVGKAAMIMFLNGDMTSIDDTMGGGLEILADGMRDLATDAAKNRARAAARRRSLVEQGYEEMGKLTGNSKKEGEEQKVEVERKPPTQAELDEAKRIRDRVRAHPVGKPPPTDDEVAEAKRIRDKKRAGTMTDADYDSLVGLIGKHSATGKKPTGEELRRYNQPEEERRKELEKFKTIVALQIKEELDREENEGRK